MKVYVLITVTTRGTHIVAVFHTNADAVNHAGLFNLVGWHVQEHDLF